MHIIEPKTKRLLLRQWKPSDLESFAAMSADPQVMRYFPNMLNRSQSDAIANKCQSLIAEKGWGVWAVELLETKEFIGIVGLHSPSAKLPCSPCIEVLWRLAKPKWGKGYATEAAKAALKIGFELLELQEIVSFAVVDNASSRAVMHRLNMENTGLNFDHPDVLHYPHLKAHCLYKITRENWLNQPA